VTPALPLHPPEPERDADLLQRLQLGRQFERVATGLAGGVSSAPGERRSAFGFFGRLGALGHDAVTSDPAVAREQLPDLVKRLFVVASSLLIRLAFVAHGGTTSFERI
jgi:hypothetical protein